MRGLKTLRLLIISPIAAAALGLSATGHTQDGDYNHLLKGDYALSQAEVCIATSSEAPVIPTFDPDTLQLLGEAEVQNLQSRGVSSFDGSGHFSASGTASGLTSTQTGVGDFPVGAPSEFNCEGNYSVAADRSFVLEMSCTLPDAGIRFGPRVLHGRISADRKTLIFADTEPVIEKIRVIGPEIVIAERVCNAIATDAKLL